MTANDLPMGTRVMFKELDALCRAERREVAGYGKHVPATSRLVKRWMRRRDQFATTNGVDDALRTGIVVGIRIKQTGWVDTNGWDEPSVFMPIERHRVYLVATSMHRDPTVLFPEDITPEPIAPGAIADLFKEARDGAYESLSLSTAPLSRETTIDFAGDVISETLDELQAQLAPYLKENQ